MLRDTPRLPAMTVVAPGVRFNALAILVTPFFSLAIVFNVRTSSFDHARRTTFFFLANFDSFFLGTGLLAREDDLARQPIRSGIRQAFLLDLSPRVSQSFIIVCHFLRAKCFATMALQAASCFW
jgi:hypothetical protein